MSPISSLTSLQRLHGFSLAKKGGFHLWKKSMSTFSSTHDYVVCGAGSAGCVVGNRLSAAPNNKVLLLEGGPSDNGVTNVQMPYGLTFILRSRQYNWFYITVPQNNLNNRVMYCPRGKVMGGTSSINGMIHANGHAIDYDRWENEGAKGWSYADCLPYFKKLENHEFGPSDYHGGDGPFYVTKTPATHPIFQAFLKAGQQAGYPFTEDYNGFQQEGFSVIDSNIYKGARGSSSNAYINPIKEERPNLQIQTDALVTKVIFDGNRAIGIEYIQNSERKRAAANKDVILCGGSINSPQLLMLSGIGDADELKKHNIPVVCHLPGVGQNLQDHLRLHIQQACTKPITAWREDKEIAELELTIEWLRNKTGQGATSAIETVAFIRSDNEVHHPDIELLCCSTAASDQWKRPTEQHSYVIFAGTLRSQSKGTIKLKSADPRDHPSIDFNYMSTEKDWKEMRACVRIAREIHQQQAFDEFRGEELSPGKHVQTENEIDEFIRATTDSNYHSTSSCKMGDSSDKMAVVDCETRVFGVEGLRVVDASIMPSVTSGNTNAPTMMIAEKAADHILSNPISLRCEVPVYKTPKKGQR